MKPCLGEQSRKKAQFIRAHTLNGVLYPIGTRLQMRNEKFSELEEKKIVLEYTGPWPPKKGRKHKTKFNLKDLR